MKTPGPPYLAHRLSRRVRAAQGSGHIHQKKPSLSPLPLPRAGVGEAEPEVAGLACRRSDSRLHSVSFVLAPAVRILQSWYFPRIVAVLVVGCSRSPGLRVGRLDGGASDSAFAGDFGRCFGKKFKACGARLRARERSNGPLRSCRTAARASGSNEPPPRVGQGYLLTTFPL
jgi:hypothetical protein